MNPEPPVIFETQRLVVRATIAADASLLHRLWTDPRVMANVGFPHGLRITPGEIEAQIARQGAEPFDRYLIAALKDGGEAIGECKMGRPGPDGIAETDVKLLPETWGHRYGVEIKQGLVDYLFTHTPCTVVAATPNVGNIASIRMQEAVGGVRVGEGVFEFPESMRSYTTPVHHYVYHVRRADWESRRQADDNHTRPLFRD
jgi:RimJ/RimL family protein N-acetyltransferase